MTAPSWKPGPYCRSFATTIPLRAAIRAMEAAGSTKGAARILGITDSSMRRYARSRRITLPKGLSGFRPRGEQPAGQAGVCANSFGPAERVGKRGRVPGAPKVAGPMFRVPTGWGGWHMGRADDPAAVAACARLTGLPEDVVRDAR